MTDGSAPSVGNPRDSSGSTPTASQPNVFPISLEEFSATMQETFRAGWRLARMLTQEEPPDVEFRPIVDTKTRSVTVESIVRKI